MFLGRISTMRVEFLISKRSIFLKQFSASMSERMVKQKSKEISTFLKKFYRVPYEKSVSAGYIFNC